jgi:protein-S-isoprenylcysteine O-methyltransferase Ste14
VQRAAATIGSAIFLIIAPGTLAVAIPWSLTHWHLAPPLFPIARALGAALIVAGLPILLDSFARFTLQGRGTPAPVMPPERLVVTRFYRHVRNPMYVAVTALIAGQGLLFGSVTVLGYGAIVWAGFFLFVVAYEEPALGEQSPSSTSATGRTCGDGCRASGPGSERPGTPLSINNLPGPNGGRRDWTRNRKRGK